MDSYNKKNVKRSIPNARTLSKNQDYILIILEEEWVIKNKDEVILKSNKPFKQVSEILVSSLKGEFNITLLLNQPYQVSEQEWQASETHFEAKVSSSKESQNSASTAFIVMAVITALSVITCLAAIIIILRSKNCTDTG
ncbi:unnamed protein product, partial [Meganyctiphanes norvegica]